MENIYVHVKFELNEGISVAEWKPMSDHINDELAGKDGFIFRDSAVDDKGNVYCILKWESEDQQKAFRKTFDESLKSKPEIMEAFGKICNMDTMTMDVLKVI